MDEIIEAALVSLGFFGDDGTPETTAREFRIAASWQTEIARLSAFSAAAADAASQCRQPGT